MAKKKTGLQPEYDRYRMWLRKQSAPELLAILERQIVWFEYDLDDPDLFQKKPEDMRRDEQIDFILDADPIAVEGGLFDFMETQIALKSGFMDFTFTVALRVHFTGGSRASDVHSDVEQLCERTIEGLGEAPMQIAVFHDFEQKHY